MWNTPRQGLCLEGIEKSSKEADKETLHTRGSSEDLLDNQH